MPICAVYSRVSTASGEQLQALEQQQARLAAAVPDGFTAVEYTDIQSGKDLDRPEFNRLMGDVRAGTIALVMATRLDRLSRNRLHGAELLDTFSADGAPGLICLDDQLDLRTVSGRLMAGILHAWAVAESERIGERTAHGHAHRRKQGKPFGPLAPQGYRFNADRSNYELDDNADLCRDLIRRFQADPQIRPWMRWANEHGLNFGSPSAFTRWIQNPALAGARVYGVSKKIQVDDPKRPGKKKTIRRHNNPGHYDEVHWDAHPELITREQHAWLIAFFAGNRSQAAAPLKDGRIRIATGLAMCGHDGCFKRMSVHQTGKTAPHFYRCNNQRCDHRYRNRVREEGIIGAAIAALQSKAKELTTRVVDVVSQEGASEPEEITNLRQQINEARALNNPRMASLITDMERELAVMLRTPRQSSQLDLEALETLLEGDEAWLEMWKEEPAHLRDLLRNHIFAVMVKDGEIVGVKTRWD